MSERILYKIGYYTFYEIKANLKTTYRVDSGKTIYIEKYKKQVPNPYRDVKDFNTITKAKEYVSKKLLLKREEKNKKQRKSVYLILLKEESSGKTFVKVGFTTQKFIINRFSKFYGYGGYVVESILRRVDTPDAEKLEKEIKEELNKKRSIKKYRPLLETFSGYSECYDLLCLSDIINVFDGVVKRLV